MPVIPSRFPVRFGDVFPLGCFVLGVEPAMEFNEDSRAPKRQERDKETNLLLWTVRALDANGEAARFGAEFKVKVACEVQPVPPAKANGFPYPAAEFEGLTITPYAGRNGRIAYSFRATGMRAPHVGRAAKPDPGESAAA
ncbi:plasmid replication, integration and excision activator [Lentzea tibetensis]|uniref:Plasmid replication, integration and excision activator n=1 Tax=Lentzea tibetensis TaxID=2591470 RepID=A0A563EUP0_9PSEU|nr:plasmid replication, integration and excision activator [Lentzea tibetensis]TWP51258.1 plasmid replication, integration and excision activator [Lentzea tibetensis]